MRRSFARFLAIPVAAAGVATAVTLVAAPAFADTVDGPGTVTITEPFSYLASLVKGGVVQLPSSQVAITVDRTGKTVSGAFPVTGGDADVTKLSGTVDLGGSVKIVSIRGKSVTLTNLQYSIDNEDITATVTGSTTPVVLLDLNGNIVFGVNGTTQTLSASELDVDPAGAAYLDGALHSKAFVAGANAGSFSASYTVTTTS